MSRRDSRVPINSRQNDALVEFENFKKKFLLANKHITKLNSTLSVRIEELNAQISILYVENLRLRASEIALAAQLKREREKSSKVMAEAELATQGFMKHLAFLRHSFHIPIVHQSSLVSSPKIARAQKPAAKENWSPNTNRLARPPDFPGIEEDEEAGLSVDSDRDNPSPTMTRKPKARLSASKLPLPARMTSPPPPIPSGSVQPLRINPGATGKANKQKPTRRQSGLLDIQATSGNFDLLPPRAASPAFGSPIRRAAGLAEDEEEELAAEERAVEYDLIVGEKANAERRRIKGKERERVSDNLPGVDGRKSSQKERRRRQDDNEAVESANLKLIDVTNSPPRRAQLPPLDTCNSDRERGTTSDMETPVSTVSALTSTSSLQGRYMPSTAATTPAQTPNIQNMHLPTPRNSISPPPAQSPTLDLELTTAGRESRRTRKSVNYTEPKLNTKMRKPDPQPSKTPPRKRASAAATLMTSDSEGRSSLDIPPVPPLPTRSSSPQPPRPSNRHSITTSHISDTTSSATTTVKKKKSQAFALIDEDEESDGEKADAEFNSVTSSQTWINVEGRRRQAIEYTATTRHREAFERRRHSVVA